ncbi:MAG: 16S rRNA (adenine(1518)-N(6)/adenine(1519)-N(6))-dimethyltransferase RsmA [Dehalococcoidia bacterium]
MSALSVRSSANPGELRGLLRRYNLRAKKSLGQHFLTDRRVLSKILGAAQVAAQDLVLEVGPGLGALTQELAARARRVVAIEVDEALASLLRRELSQLPNLEIVVGDILEMKPGELVRNQGLGDSQRSDMLPRYKVVANLPYYIANPVLRHFLEASHKPSRMVVMVQKEVGETIVAQPGKMGLLSLGVQVYGKPFIVCRVPSRSFYPSPKVDSVVVAIDVYGEPVVEEPEAFFRIARAGFSAPRKQLHNSLSQGLAKPADEVKELLRGVGIDGRRRASTLSLEEWDLLCRTFRQNPSPC